MGTGKGGRNRSKIGQGARYPYRDDEEREQVCDRIERGATNEDIAAAVGWTPEEVRDCRARFYPTKGLAERYLRANALKMAMRVVTQANVEETIDVLSRPNIGVLAPAVKPGATQNFGIFTSIQLDSLGGVQAQPSLIEGHVVESAGPEPRAVAPANSGGGETRPAAVAAPVPVLKTPQATRAAKRPSRAPLR